MLLREWASEVSATFQHYTSRVELLWRSLYCVIPMVMP